SRAAPSWAWTCGPSTRRWCWRPCRASPPSWGWTVDWRRGEALRGMELEQLIKSRAHRILHRLDGYYPVSETSTIPFTVGDEILRAVDGELIGYYINPGEGHKGV